MEELLQQNVTRRRRDLGSFCRNNLTRCFVGPPEGQRAEIGVILRYLWIPRHVGQLNRGVDAAGGHSGLDPLDLDIAVRRRMLAHDLSHKVNRIREQDVLRHPAEVVVDQHPDGMRLTVRMAGLEEHGAGVVEYVLAHHRRVGYHDLPKLRRPCREGVA